MKETDRNHQTAGVRNGHNGAATAARPTGGKRRQAETLVAGLRAVVRDMFIVDDEASDLPLRQVRVCMILSAGPQSMSALSRELGVSLSATTQIADRLEAAGLATRLLEGADRRVRCLQLTPRARKIMQRRERIKVRRAQAALARMRPKERKLALAAVATLQRASRESRTT